MHNYQEYKSITLGEIDSETETFLENVIQTVTTED